MKQRHCHCEKRSDEAIQKKGYFLRIICFIFAIFLSEKSFSAELPQINKNLYLIAKSSHVLSFDEKIISYKFQNGADFKTEIMPDIYNSRQILIIKPLNILNNKLTVQTGSKIYNYEIKVEPEIRENDGAVDFVLDNPPEIKKNKP